MNITANEGEAIENELIYGSVSGKKSNEDGEDLGGAFIGIFKTGTTEYTKERKMLSQLPHPRMTAVFLLPKYRMAHG